MPIYNATPGTGVNFDGLSAATGLFDAAKNTGGAAIQVRVNSISFSGATTITDWTLASVDPSDSQTTILLSSTTTTTFAAGGPMGFMLLPTNDDGVPWNMTLVTTGITGDGVLKIDFDFDLTEG